MLATQSKTTVRRRSRKTAKSEDPDMLVKLYELLQGDRDEVRLYSNILNSELWFINPALKKEDAYPADQPVYTTREIAFVLSMSPDELRRYHYLKTKLA